jgi:hypothetical protein
VTPPKLITIVVLTPAVVGTTGADPLGPDRDVRVDGHGLPFIPRARMSARFRDAALAVTQARPDSVGPALALFGRAGQVGGRRALSIGPALLPRLVRAAVTEAYGGPSADRVTRAGTVELDATAMNEHGAPVPGSLRRFRALAPGLVLEAELTWIATPDDAMLRTLARCCLALRQIGGGESRGAGRVRCLLDGDPDRAREIAGLVPHRAPEVAP